MGRDKRKNKNNIIERKEINKYICQPSFYLTMMMTQYSHIKERPPLPNTVEGLSVRYSYFLPTTPQTFQKHACHPQICARIH